MDAYILGHHDGELPTHLLKEGEPGHRVRTIAKLEGPHHNAYYALEAPDEQSLDALHTKVTKAGTKTHHFVRVAIHEAARKANDSVKHNPTFCPPFREVRFIVRQGLEDVIDAVHDAHKTLGLDGVGAANDGKGNFVVQLGHDDKTVVDKAAEHFEHSAGGTSTGIHSVSAEGIHRAT